MDDRINRVRYYLYYISSNANFLQCTLYTCAKNYEYKINKNQAYFLTTLYIYIADRPTVRHWSQWIICVTTNLRLRHAWWRCYYCKREVVRKIATKAVLAFNARSVALSYCETVQGMHTTK